MSIQMMNKTEFNFPYEKISLVAKKESWRKEVNRPLYHMHKWWATRLGSVFRAMCIDALSDGGLQDISDFYKKYSFDIFIYTKQ